MTNPKDDAGRLEYLELKIMDLENSFQQLNDVVLRQYHDIERLRKKHDQLIRKVESIDDQGPEPEPKDEVPPHY